MRGVWVDDSEGKPKRLLERRAGEKGAVMRDRVDEEREGDGGGILDEDGRRGEVIEGR